MSDFKFTAEYVIAQLAKLHEPKDWAFFVELRLGTGFGKDSEQRFDAWALHYLKGKRHVSRCFEVKVSKSDFMHEIRKPLKRRAGLRLSNEFYFVTPKDMLQIEEIPVECGLMEVDEFGQIYTKIQAPFRDIMPPTWQFFASVCKRIDAARRKEWEVEERIKGVVFEREVITRMCLQKHLEKWRTHNVGSREIPDHILDALEDLHRDVEVACQTNRKTR